MNVIAENNVSHQEHLQNTHQDSDHHDHKEALSYNQVTLQGESEHSEADHPDCHANHCHHSNLIYLDLSAQLVLLSNRDKQLINQAVSFNSLPITPDSRPPIV
mgnify:FL=1